MHIVWQNPRSLPRMPAKRPRLKLIATITLAFGIGANGALLAANPPEKTTKRAQSKPIAFTHATVIDVVTGLTRPDTTVIITGDRISEVGPSRRIAVPRNARVINAKGKFLIPGLWDMHVHLGMAGESSLAPFFMNGVTGVRDMGGEDFQQIKQWREKTAAGAILGPLIKASGPIIETHRFIQVLERLTGESVEGKRIGVTTVADAERAVESIASLGVDFIKIRTNPTRTVFFALAAEAKKRNLALVGHAPTGITLVEASDAGMKSIEHGLTLFGNFSDEQLKETAEHFLKNGTHLVPTLIAGKGFRQTPDEEVMAITNDSTGGREPRLKYASRRLVELWRKQIEMKKQESPMDWKAITERNLAVHRALYRAGVPVMAGTDLGGPLVFPGFSLHDELELLVKELGLTAAQALRSAMIIPAEFLGLKDSLGSIEKAKRADLVLLDANPLGEIANTRRIDSVIIGGRLIAAHERNEILTRIAAEAGKK